MTKLYSYINEEKMTEEEIANLIKENCKPYLQLLNNRTPAFRRTRNHHGILIEKQTRKNRKQRGQVPSIITSRLNEWLKKNGYAPRNESVIGNFNADNILATLGKILYFLLPIGQFKYTYVKSFDFNITGTDDFNRIYLNVFNYEKDPDIESNLFIWDENDRKIIKDLQPDDLKRFFFKSNITAAIKNGYEIWFQCKKYYLLNADSAKANHALFYKVLK